MLARKHLVLVKGSAAVAAADRHRVVCCMPTCTNSIDIGRITHLGLEHAQGVVREEEVDDKVARRVRAVGVNHGQLGLEAAHLITDVTAVKAIGMK